MVVVVVEVQRVWPEVWREVGPGLPGGVEGEPWGWRCVVPSGRSVGELFLPVPLLLLPRVVVSSSSSVLCVSISSCAGGGVFLPWSLLPLLLLGPRKPLRVVAMGPVYGRGA